MRPHWSPRARGCSRCKLLSCQNGTSFHGVTENQEHAVFHAKMEGGPLSCVVAGRHSSTTALSLRLREFLVKQLFNVCTHPCFGREVQAKIHRVDHGPLSEADPMMFFSIFYPKSIELEANLKVWWYFRLRVMKSCIETMVLELRILLPVWRCRWGNRFWIFGGEVLSNIWIEMLNAYINRRQVLRTKLEIKGGDLGIVTLYGT